MTKRTLNRHGKRIMLPEGVQQVRAKGEAAPLASHPTPPAARTCCSHRPQQDWSGQSRGLTYDSGWSLKVRSKWGWRKLGCFCAEKSEEKIQEMGRRIPPTLQNRTLHNQNEMLQVNNWKMVMQNTLRVLYDSHDVIRVSHTPGQVQPAPQTPQLPFWKGNTTGHAESLER